MLVSAYLTSFVLWQVSDSNKPSTKSTLHTQTSHSRASIYERLKTASINVQATEDSVATWHTEHAARAIEVLTTRQAPRNGSAKRKDLVPIPRKRS